MLHLCPVADEASLWVSLDLAPTPAHAACVTEEEEHRILHTHWSRRISATDVLEALCTPALQGAPVLYSTIC
jgi:hypothetical protein